MNKSRRRLLTEVIDTMSKCIDSVSNIYEEEIEALSNMPENLEGSDRYEEMEARTDILDDIVDRTDEIVSMLEEASR